MNQKALGLDFGLTFAVDSQSGLRQNTVSSSPPLPSAG